MSTLADDGNPLNAALLFAPSLRAGGRRRSIAFTAAMSKDSAETLTGIATVAVVVLTAQVFAIKRLVGIEYPSWSAVPPSGPAPSGRPKQ